MMCYIDCRAKESSVSLQLSPSDNHSRKLYSSTSAATADTSLFFRTAWHFMLYEMPLEVVRSILDARPPAGTCTCLLRIVFI
jgi:hypothetical protein